MSGTLRGLSDIRGHFVRDATPTWYICASPYTLLGLDEWVRGMRFLTWADPFDGQHPRLVSPPHVDDSTFPFEILEEMNAWLLSQPATVDAIRAAGPGRALMLLFDERAEALCAELGLTLCFPSAELRRRVDSKTEATRLAEAAGVPCVPNVLGPAPTWEALRRLAGHLGEHLVIQTPFGDSGTTTFFVSCEADFERCRGVVAREPEVKVMKRIRPAQGAVEACVTRAGTVVGPLMTEIVGFPELTPYAGGWAGNEVAAAAFTEAQRVAAAEGTTRFGNALAGLGYRGYFEIDWLIDEDDGQLYLGEVNPRLTGASPLTNLAAFAHADLPLALLHLLEFSGLDFEIDTARLTRRWADPENMDAWGQLILKYTDGPPLRLDRAPRTGVWRMGRDGRIEYRHAQLHRRTVDDEADAFLLRLAAPGEVVQAGDDLAVLVLRGRLLDETRDLTARARAWIAATRAEFGGRSG